MKLFGGDMIILRPEQREPTINDQVKNCIEQLDIYCQKKDLSKDSFYKFILFLNKTNSEDYDSVSKELKRLIKDKIHKDVLVLSLAQPPVDSDVVMEVYYYDQEQWESRFYSDTSGESVVFRKDAINISVGYVSASNNDCGINTRNTFSSLELILSKTGFSLGNIIRQWNYIEGILQYDGPHQHYQIFNDIRSKFYADHFSENGYPAATGIGIKKGGVIIEYMTAFKSGIKTIPIDNLKQVPAYKYNEEVLMGESINKVKTTPKFERGRYLSVLDNEIVYISGTASISGEQVIYPDNSNLQTLYTIENIDELISEENLNRKNINTGALQYAYIRIYVKDKNDFLQTYLICQKKYGKIPCVLIQADICRDDLLVEIEGYININNQK